ncbi:hypothetical protein BT69DRAFT_301864 [Atractiella rhizophila]|nr:hypothetical protein BT69DRAFT_301864 [Atractiella rhizophila]
MLSSNRRSSLMRIDNVSIAPDGATSASAPPSTPPPKKSDATPAIVGGVLGGLALLALVLIGVVIIVRRAGRSNTKMDEKMAALTQANNTTMRSETASVPMSTTGQSEKHSHQRTVTGSSSAVYPNSPFGTGHVASRSFQNSVSPPYPPNTVSPHNNTSSAMSNASQRRNNYSRSDDASTQYQFSPPPPSQFSTPASVPDVYPSPDPRPDSTGTQVSWQSNSNNYSNSSYFVDPNAPPLPVNQGGSQSRVELYRPQGVRVEEENLERPDRYSIYRKKR